MSLISKEQLHLFNKGEDFQSYKTFGCHKSKHGFVFSVWAPSAKSVSIVGEFNNWDIHASKMDFHKHFGVWDLEIKNAKYNDLYKYYIVDHKGKGCYKSDPYGYENELRPGTASRICDLDSYVWKDSKWRNKKKNIYSSPKVIYELHMGSWKRHEDGSYYTYVDLVGELIPYVKKMGFTHIELMPILEHPFDGSWGYQLTGYYSATSRYGTPSDFKYFIDCCHQAGISVILDWVPAHFPRDISGLSDFDGQALYEYADSRIGEHKEWGTKVFNYKKGEVQSFLISNAMFWIEEYHIDGIRVDAVSSMLYRDYNRRDWLPNKHGGNENLEAIEFLQKLNTAIFAKFPDTLMIAEESTAWANVTKPIEAGGLGFNFKWNMGWMHDILDYMSLDPVLRKGSHNKITFSMHYAFAENYILPLSHDEVVHGKGSILNKMSGEYEQKFASCKALYAYMMAHPGAKLLFMGNELGQFSEWNYESQLDWNLLEYDMHRNLKKYLEDLIHLYKSTNSLWQNDKDWNGFEWLIADDNLNSVIAFARYNNSKREKTIVICNFTPVERKGYKIPVSQKGVYKEILNSNNETYGGTTKDSEEIVFYDSKQKRDKSNYLSIDLPPMSAIYLKKV